MSAILGAPWRWDGELDEVLEANGNTVAIVPEAYGSFGPALAAVPELVAALEKIAALSPALRSGGPDPSDLDELSNALEEAVDVAHAALAKAKGEG